MGYPQSNIQSKPEKMKEEIITLCIMVLFAGVSKNTENTLCFDLHHHMHIVKTMSF